jgi:hypothetical protein
MKLLVCRLVGVVVLSAAVMPVIYSQSLTTAHKFGKTNHASPENGRRLIEEFSFVIKDFRMDHQTETNNMNISISYRYMVNIANPDYPDFRLLAKDVETLLNNYPNEDDYWEIVNKQATSLLMSKYPALSSITVEITIDPTRHDPYTRTTRVTRERSAIKSNRKRM